MRDNFSPSPYSSISAALVGPNKTIVRRLNASDRCIAKRITRDHQAACRHERSKVPDRIIASGIDQGHARSRCQSFVPLAFLRSAKKHELCGPFFATRSISSRYPSSRHCFSSQRRPAPVLRPMIGR